MADRIIALPALKDNYIWALINQSTASAIIIDPGVSDVVLDFLVNESLTLAAILITHHHWDHSNGIAAICEKHNVAVYGPATESIAGVTHPLRDHDEIEIAAFPRLQVLAIPGHTKGHIAYYTPNHVFCGDTLFAAGCGRLFEGTPIEMYQSLQRLAALPEATKVHCAHEYTLNNLAFAQTVEPHNQAITDRIKKIKDLRNQGLPSLPGTLLEEKETNPFLRCQEAAVIKAAANYFGMPLKDPISVFAALRKWKDHF